LAQRLERFCGVEERQVGDADEDRRVRCRCIPQSSPGRVPGNAESCACDLERAPPAAPVTTRCRLDPACTLEAAKQVIHRAERDVCPRPYPAFFDDTVKLIAVPRTLRD